MSRKRFTVDSIIRKLREAEVGLEMPTATTKSTSEILST